VKNRFALQALEVPDLPARSLVTNNDCSIRARLLFQDNCYCLMFVQKTVKSSRYYY